MRPSEHRKIKEPELEPVFAAGPHAFATDYTHFTDILVRLFLSVKSVVKKDLCSLSAAAEPRPNPNHFTGGNGGRGENESGSSETIHPPRITRISRIFLPLLIRVIREIRGSSGLLIDPSVWAQAHPKDQTDEPRRHGDTKTKHRRKDRDPPFVPWCLCGESSGSIPISAVQFDHGFRGSHGFRNRTSSANVAYRPRSAHPA